MILKISSKRYLRIFYSRKNFLQFKNVQNYTKTDTEPQTIFKLLINKPVKYEHHQPYHYHDTSSLVLSVQILPTITERQEKILTKAHSFYVFIQQNQTTTR